MKCSADASARQPLRTAGREVIIWTLTCLTKCAVGSYVERRGGSLVNGTLLRKLDE